MITTTSKIVAVACDECGMDLTYTIVTSDDGDERTCTLACTWCSAVVDERVEKRSTSSAIVCFGGGKSSKLDVETWA